MNEIAICAAVKAADGTVVRGHRHHNCLHAIFDMGKTPLHTEGAQGFITSHNRFVGRVEARNLQDAAGIDSVAEGGYRGNGLFSEDLY